MPVMNGVELLTRLREDPRYRDIPGRTRTRSTRKPSHQWIQLEFLRLRRSILACSDAGGLGRQPDRCLRGQLGRFLLPQTFRRQQLDGFVDLDWSAEWRFAEQGVRCDGGARSDSPRRPGPKRTAQAQARLRSSPGRARQGPWGPGDGRPEVDGENCHSGDVSRTARPERAVAVRRRAAYGGGWPMDVTTPVLVSKCFNIDELSMCSIAPSCFISKAEPAGLTSAACVEVLLLVPGVSVQLPAD
jgi:hypothetical protein